MPVLVNEMEHINASSDDDMNSIKEDDDKSLPDDDDFSETDGENNFFEKLEGVKSKKRKRQADESEVGVEDVSGIADTNILKRRKKKKDVNTKPPTAEEMTQLRETENLFHSNLFRMQIEEMMKEVRLKKYERKSIKQWLQKLMQFLLNVDDVQGFTLQSLGDYKIPLSIPPKELECSFIFLKPSSVDIRGSFKAGCCLGSSMAVDIFVTMPKKCFLKSDYLNAQYHYKRALYMTQLAKLLDENELVDREKGIEYCLKSGDPMKPSLLVRPAGKLNKFEVFIHPVPQEQCFKLSKLMVDKCNVKSAWWMKGMATDAIFPTPHYNNSVTQDLVVAANERLRLEVLDANPNLREAVILIHVWLRQRELDKGYGSFSGYIASMLVVYLFRTRRLNTFMSSYQIVRNVWLALSESDWTKEGVSLSTAIEDTPSLQGFHQHFDVVFVDITGYCNLTAQMSKFTYTQVKQEASLAIQCLDNPDINSFHALFLTQMPFLHQFDHIIRIDDEKTIKKVAKGSSLEAQQDTLGHNVLLFTQIVTSLLQRAMNHRMALITVKLNPPKVWSIKQKCSKKVDGVMIGLRLNSETALSVIDKGPPANLPEAADFRELWGAKSELRRFKDGNVCEAVVWADAGVPIAKRRLIVKDIVTYLLTTKLNIKSSCVVYLADQLEPLISKTPIIPNGFDYGTGEEAARHVIDAYDKLAKQLRALSDLPLDISSIQGVSPVFRFCDIFPPLAGCSTSCKGTIREVSGKSCVLMKDKAFRAPRYIAPVEVVVHLGLSSKWPDDIKAVRLIRAAFNVQIAKSLRAQCNLQAQPYPDFVDVAKDGFVFRVHVAYSREVVLLKEMTALDGKVMYRDTPKAVELEKSTINLPKLSGALYGLSQQCPGFGPATCLAKRWLHSQLFNSLLFPDIVTELLMAYLYITPEPFRALIQPQAGLLRFLKLLATTNWYLEPIIVSFNADLKREDILEIESYFRNERPSLPPLFIATQFDRTRSLWTKEAPVFPVVAWLTKVAAEALRTLEHHFLTLGSPTDCKQIFRPPMHIYDAFIRLRSRLSPLHSYGVDYDPYDPPLQLQVPKDKDILPVVGFDPVQRYLSELKENYGEFALFFHDTYGGEIIGVLFKPAAFEEHEFKVSHMNCHKPVLKGDSTMLNFNFAALIDDFYFVGKDLVANIELRLEDNIFEPPLQIIV